MRLARSSARPILRPRLLGEKVVEALLLLHRARERRGLRIVERQLRDLVGELLEAAVHARVVDRELGIVRARAICCATRSIAAMRSTSERLARAACDALNTALRLRPARRSVFHAE